VIEEGLSSLKSYMVRFTSETETQLNILNVKVIAEGHIDRVKNALAAKLDGLRRDAGRPRHEKDHGFEGKS
jgi:hypothetical protein